jgi:hypothetical protein
MALARVGAKPPALSEAGFSDPCGVVASVGEDSPATALDLNGLLERGCSVAGGADFGMGCWFGSSVRELSQQAGTTG